MLERHAQRMGYNNQMVAIRNNWIKVQSQHDYPVNAIGVKIDVSDGQTLREWKIEGIDRLMRSNRNG